ncbi:MAG: GtrA family protein [Methanobrevibacter sp.]|jgi:putative flippase GtrA|nr:GtrA family protein [Methanobrevibacter sp.]
MFKFKEIITKEIILYLVFGVLTTLVNIFSYFVLVKIFLFNYLIGNIIAWLISVIFAYITNRKWVFDSENINIPLEFSLFLGGRLFSGILDSGLMYLAIDLLSLNDMFSKVMINIIVVIINYLFSKIIVFK